MSDVLNTNGLAPVALSLDTLRTRLRGEFAEWKRIATEKTFALE